MTKEKVIQTLIDDYSKQAKLSKRERTIYKHGLLTGIEIGPMEEPEVDFEKELERLDSILYDLDGIAIAGTTSYLTVEDVKDIAKRFFEMGLKAQKGE